MSASRLERHACETRTPEIAEFFLYVGGGTWTNAFVQDVTGFVDDAHARRFDTEINAGP
jgi:hypothetical protein